MKNVLFKYNKIGHIILLDEKDWIWIVKYLEKNNFQVDETILTPKPMRKKASVSSKK